MSFRETLSQMWSNIQYKLFPQLENELGILSSKLKRLVSILELVRIEQHIPCTRFNDGRPPKDRAAIARAYVAKIVFMFTNTTQLLECLKRDKQLMVICGWDSILDVPSESTFSRAFDEFAELSLPNLVHQALIRDVYKNKIVGSVVKDSMPIEAREKPAKKEGSRADRKRSKDKERMRKKRAGEPNLRQKQLTESNVDKLVDELPKHCDIGMKRSAGGYTKIWTGYKLHMAIDDNCVSLAAIVTSASLNDSEAAIPLGAKSNKVAKNLYDIMDAAYDHPEIKAHSTSLGHVPLIDRCPNNTEQKIEKDKEKQRKKILNFETAEDIRYKSRFSRERCNALYKDFHGGRNIFYRGHAKVSCHVMFGVLVATASTILKLIQ